MTVEAISPLRRCMIEESNHPVKAARQHVKGCPLPLRRAGEETIRAQSSTSVDRIQGRVSCHPPGPV